ncbi:cytochrome P450 [Actinoplanes bogorensis]|uniref:Cytochrome P450 n=1 Tax=Paractinoplanes bogorensis TaxID=1610840 RepID=A0ABS5YK85_9ACTN|nr:cytochrome P450 [Actinoplanes bogorensis]MBU2663842.1 cytochrome P450 [Actinoplanes bogorensis]
MTTTTHDELPLVTLDQPTIMTFGDLRLDLQKQAGLCKIRTPAGHEAWLVTRHAEVKALLSDTRLGRSHPDPANAPKFLNNPMLDMLITDAPPAVERQEHMKKQRLYTGSFAARRVLDQRARVEAISERMLDDILAKGMPADLHGDYSMPFSQEALCDMMGVPDADRTELLSMMDRVGNANDEADSYVGMDTLFAYSLGIAAKVRANPGDNVISRFTEAGLPDQEIATHIVALLFTGLSGLASHIDYGITLFLRNPDQLALAMADPEVMSQAVEEVLRATIGSPVLPRYAHEDIELDGKTIKQGELVMIDFSLANYDPRVFEEPFAFRVSRSPNPHFTFSYGMRHCTGAPLVRIVLHVAYSTLFRRIPSLKLAVPYEALHRHPGGRLAGGLAELPVTW